jgi:hypothetical protein
MWMAFSRRTTYDAYRQLQERIEPFAKNKKYKKRARHLYLDGITVERDSVEL